MRKSKLGSLSAEARKELHKWLFKDSLTYAACLERLRTQFGVSASSASLSEYYNKLLRPRYVAKPGDILLDLRITPQAGGGFRLVVVQPRTRSNVVLIGGIRPVKADMPYN